MKTDRKNSRFVVLLLVSLALLTSTLVGTLVNAALRMQILA